MRAKRSIVIGGLAASLLGGGAAVAARSGDDGDKAEQAILSDAAKRLGVDADDLESALAKAEDAQLDQAVKDGDLTKKQADEIKKHRKRDGRVLGVPGGPMGGHGFGERGFHVHGGPGFGGPGGGLLDAVADELGITVEKLFSELRDGKTLAQVAKAHDKSLADVKEAAKGVLSKRLDTAVKEGHLTRKQADEILERLPDLIDHLGKGPGGPGGRPGFGPPPGNGEGAVPAPRWQ